MKIKANILISVLMIFFSISLTSNAFSDTPPPPPSGGHGSGGNQVPGGGAPIGSALVLLIALAAGYGGKKVYDFKKKLAD